MDNSQYLELIIDISNSLIPRILKLNIPVDLYQGNTLTPEQEREFDCMITKNKIKRSRKTLFKSSKNDEYHDEYNDEYNE